ncbi:AcrR family transcriptional regulator [Litorivivens lipolytica]|uniref:AcrR family transcriptional regulator n=1 Tax=Litorivivens lipolytica TaxID=1524264 RepID=A0A7W4Z4W2_9GAMM|nr:TetR/AcrR family transcriptional regulator [Litorivivens lipolytica]MBB3046894.1 AcrR family transcriptional regulator [Litorivivens lipolytica]
MNDITPEGTRERLILTAEQLFASKGIESVSLREIARTAGQKNVAAMQYHFGDREGLFSAILEYRMRNIDAFRTQLLQACDEAGEGEQLPALLRCLVVPFVEHIRQAGLDSHYIEYLARLQVSYPEFLAEASLTRPWQASVKAISQRIHHLIPGPESLRNQRQLMIGICMIHSVAAFERGLREGRYQLSELEAFTDNLIDALCGIVLPPQG